MLKIVKFLFLRPEYVSNGKIMHGFFEKPMRTDKCLDANTALSHNVIMSALRQEIIRRLLNMHLETPISEKIFTLDLFYEKFTSLAFSTKIWQSEKVEFSYFS